MNYLSYNESKNLKKDDLLLVNQRVENLVDPMGNKLDFCVKNGDEVIFKEILYLYKNQNDSEHDKKECGMVFVLKEDSHNRNSYGEFILTNNQVKFA